MNNHKKQLEPAEEVEQETATEKACEYFDFEGMRYGEDGEELETAEEVEQKAIKFLSDKEEYRGNRIDKLFWYVVSWYNIDNLNCTDTEIVLNVQKEMEKCTFDTDEELEEKARELLSLYI